MMNQQDPHYRQPVLHAGTALQDADAAMIMVHGRGGSAEDILSLTESLQRPDFAYLAPQAAGHTWYPYSFMSPIERNEPYLTSALAFLASTVQAVVAAGIGHEQLILLGFSQGACLSLEFTARNARRYGGIAALTGGLIGPDDSPREYPGDLAGTPIFIGTSDPDPHVPVLRAAQSRDVLERLGAEVELRVYPGMGHTVNTDEIEAVRALMEKVSPAL